MSPSPLPDYYRILQVHPLAEQEVIEAAYRCLMRKYHPDTLDPDQRHDPEVQRKVREINEAYETLGNVDSRARYDTELRSREASFPGKIAAVVEGLSKEQGAVEKRMYPARCSRTKHGFQILLARKEGSTGPFQVAGFAPLEDEPERAELATPSEEGNFLKRLLDRLFQRRTTQDILLRANLPSDQELEAMFDETLVLDFGDIDWAGFKCPVCAGEFTHPDGILSTWTICGKCSHLCCAGGIKRTPVGGIYSCPWCGARRQITYHVGTGTKAHKYVRGRLDRSYRKLHSDRPPLSADQQERHLPPETKK